MSTNGSFSALSVRVAEAIADRRRNCDRNEAALPIRMYTRERAYLDAFTKIAGWHKPAWDGGQLCGECDLGWPCPTFAEVAAALGITEQEQQ